MSVNPHQRKPISLKELKVLRVKLLRAYSINNGGEELETPNNKSSPYYTLLKDDILIETGAILSEGTLLKFFQDDAKRTYQIITIDTIKKYISKHDTAKIKTLSLKNWDVFTNVSTPD